MTITAAVFVKGATKSSQFPKIQVPEFAFFGRSNAGKSSLINMILNRKSLVKTGSKPGMTREINFFMINPQSERGGIQKNSTQVFSIADLPGYGFAQVSLAQRNAIDTMLYEYCTGRTELATLFFLMDIRREPGEIEKKTYNFFLERGINTVIVATKADKISKNSRLQRLVALSAFFSCEKEAIILTSSTKKEGREKLLRHIEANLTVSA